MAESYELTKVIEALRNDIGKAIEAGKGKALSFDVDEVEVELKTIIEENRNGDGGFNFSVVKFGGGFEDKNSQSHTITLKLTPSHEVETPEGKKSNKARIAGQNNSPK